MKKTVLLLSSILVSVPTFAYGYGSDLDDSLTWIGVLFFVWGILEIILFFKIWGATNDIDKLKSAICDGKKGNGMSSYLKKMYLLGKEDEAYNYLMTFPSKAKAYEGKLNDSNSFKEFFQMQREFEEKASKLYLYAHLNSDLNKNRVLTLFRSENTVFSINDSLY